MGHLCHVLLLDISVSLQFSQFVLLAGRYAFEKQGHALPRHTVDVCTFSSILIHATSVRKTLLTHTQKPDLCTGPGCKILNAMS